MFPGTHTAPVTNESASAQGASGWVERLRFLVFGRALPATLFAWLGSLILGHFLASLRNVAGTHDWLSALAAARLGLYFLFCVIPVAIYLTRPRPQARDGRLAPRLAAFAGTTMLLIVGAIVPEGPLLVSPPRPIVVLGTILLVAGTALGVYGLLHLRHSFSIIPEARQLVTAGPYALVRHPLYAAEVISAVALVLPGPRLFPALALLPFVGVQLARMHFEEALLQRSFPQYRDYMRRTPRLVPIYILRGFNIARKGNGRRDEPGTAFGFGHRR
jgi:protein-S-isoprenylcysteine O-methyltransferase Ste14